MNAELDLNLPAVISDYLAASNHADTDAIVACFTPDALVIDEDRRWRGMEAIRRWRESVATAYEYTVEITGAKALDSGEDAGGGERHEVYTHLEGNFPGGKVDLTDYFTLRDGRIARLAIAPTPAAS